MIRHVLFLAVLGSFAAFAGTNPKASNLYLTLLDRMKVPTESLGDSTGQLEHLSELSA